MFHVNPLLCNAEESHEISRRLDVSCESSAMQRIHMKYQALSSLKNNEKVFINIVCCSLDWHFEG